MPPKKKTKAPARKTKAPQKKKAAAKRSSSGASAVRGAGKQQFLDTLAREHATTMKVLRALPDGQGDFRPHPRSQSARDLAYTFVMEQVLITKALTDQLTLGGGMPTKPDDFDAIVEWFDQDFRALVDLVQKTSDATFESTVKFPTGPKQMGEWPKLAFAWFMLSDQIHHRGQLSVYVKMTGGKVPSIYGPSGDEPWT